MEVIYNAKAGHTGGDLSCLNVLTALYFKYLNIDPRRLDDPDRDRFILSKGHCVEALFTVLEALGILPKDELDSLGHFGSPLAGHPTSDVPGIEVSSGALGHGLPIGVGMALAAKMDGASWKTFVLMGDGEQGEGSIYEAAMAGHQYKLDNLVAIIDRNHLQISGDTEDVMAIDDIHAKWTAFGWDVMEMDGDDMDDICRAFEAVDYGNGKPHLIISNTTKGLGVSFMENEAKWHHGVPTDAQFAQAMKELDERIEKVREA
jgi:transketolase